MNICDTNSYRDIPSPCYVVEEKLLRRNLSLLRSVSEEAGVNIILAFKAFAMWKLFPIVREYITASTASSLFEARLALEEMGSLAHTYSPAYKKEDFPEILRCSSHITFNSLTQFNSFHPLVEASGRKVSCGLRINPEYSGVGVEIYNPCSPGSRMGITRDRLASGLPEGVEGFHFHALCESSAQALEEVLAVVEERFGHFLPHLKWINMGGGHLITRKDYDTRYLIRTLLEFKHRHPNLEVILEPGSAFAWQTGYLFTTVQDIVENHDVRTAIVDASFTCHMPDCLEMPYKPAIRSAIEKVDETDYTYRIGGNSCLSGDYMGDWSFKHPIEVGDNIIFEDMIHYTTVKSNMFNGISHPSLAIRHEDGSLEVFRTFDYDDYKSRMS